MIQTIPILLALATLPQDTRKAPDERDSDRDGLSDFHELHKYFTDPERPDSDGDGIPDGDWDERREFSYSVRAVLQVMAPFDVASMNDDYQDVRVLEQRPDLLEFEVVVYPFNTVAEAIVPDAGWRETPATLKDYVRPGVCSNWDEELRAELAAELRERGVDLGSLDDVETAEQVSQWLMERSAFEDSFTTFAVTFDGGEPRVAAGHEESVERALSRRGRSNEPFGDLRELTIRRLSWYDDPQRPARRTTSLQPPEERYFFAHFDTNEVDGREALRFYRSVDKAFVLRAAGHPDVPARGIGKFWGDSGDFLLEIEPGDLAHMARGVPYELVWSGAGDALRWKVAAGARLQR